MTSGPVTFVNGAEEETLFAASDAGFLSRDGNALVEHRLEDGVDVVYVTTESGVQLLNPGEISTELPEGGTIFHGR